MIARHQFFLACIVIFASLLSNTSAMKHVNDKDELSVINFLSFDDEIYSNVSCIIARMFSWNNDKFVEQYGWNMYLSNVVSVDTGFSFFHFFMHSHSLNV